MTKPIVPITDESFAQAWHYARVKYYWAKKKSLARHTITFLSQILFFLVFTLLSYGTVYTLSSGLLRCMLNEFPLPIRWWDSLSRFLFASASGDSGKLLRMALALYGLPIASALVLAVPVFLIYHPRAPQLPEKPLAQARELWITAKQIKACQEKEGSRVYVFCGMLLGVSAAGLIAMFFLFYARRPDVAAVLKTHAGPSQLYFALAVLGVFLAYWLLQLPLQLVLLPLTRCQVSKTLFEDAECYYKLVQGRNRQEIRENLQKETARETLKQSLAQDPRHPEPAAEEAMLPLKPETMPEPQAEAPEAPPAETFGDAPESFGDADCGE